jgi:alkanesulfonate monooxygenase SsuD/methylene tetrahydromethanopterin reductase-like flavin-dependent oxidoreductase (luciferase family)
MGLFIFPWGKDVPSPKELVDWSVEAEQIGFDSVQIPWHYTLPQKGGFKSFGNRACHDALPIMAAIAQATSKIRLGINSVVLPVMDPFPWAKYFATMSHLSDGRFFAAAAAGWWTEDFQANRAPMRGRTARMEEGIVTVRELLAGKTFTSPGRNYDVSGLALEPVPEQTVEFWYGGGVKAVDRAARIADVLCPVSPTPRALTEEYAPALKAAEAEHGKRPLLASITYVLVEPDQAIRESFRNKMIARVNGITIEEAADADEEQRTNTDESVVWGSAQECAERINELSAAGVDYFVLDFNFHGIESVEFGREQMHRFVDEVLPLLPAS